MYRQKLVQCCNINSIHHKILSMYFKYCSNTLWWSPAEYSFFFFSLELLQVFSILIWNLFNVQKIYHKREKNALHQSKAIILLLAFNTLPFKHMKPWSKGKHHCFSKPNISDYCKDHCKYHLHKFSRSPLNSGSIHKSSHTNNHKLDHGLLNVKIAEETFKFQHSWSSSRWTSE